MEDNQKCLIIGGCGSLGKELIKQLYYTEAYDITVLSRDEHKQQVLKKIYPKVKFVLGDIRDKQSLSPHLDWQDVVYYVAALKHIDHLEENPIECIKTNVLGTINVAEACIENGIPYCVFSSTDKAVDPINVYGNSKAISEKILFNYNQTQKITAFSVYRWGNVLASQGSVIPYFIECLRKGLPLPVTSREMTRFWLKIEDAVSFILNTYKLADLDKVMIHPTMKSSTLIEVIEALASIMGIQDYEIEDVGLRKGEKIHESLISKHCQNQVPVSSDTSEKYALSELEELLRDIVLDSTRLNP